MFLTLFLMTSCQGVKSLEMKGLEASHSYGGLVIGGVAEKVPERIRRLVYLDAYIPQDNKSAFDIIPGLETIYKERALKIFGL